MRPVFLMVGLQNTECHEKVGSTVGPQRQKIGKTSRTQNFRFLIIFSVKMGIFDVFEDGRLGLTPSTSSKITFLHHFRGIGKIGQLSNMTISVQNRNFQSILVPVLVYLMFLTLIE